MKGETQHVKEKKAIPDNRAAFIVLSSFNTYRDLLSLAPEFHMKSLKGKLKMSCSLVSWLYFISPVISVTQFSIFT